jgi:excisionase family DNA binding protein
MTKENPIYKSRFEEVQHIALDEQEAARRLSVSAPHLANLRKDGRVPYFTIGNRVLYPVRELQQWVSNNCIWPADVDSSPTPKTD